MRASGWSTTTMPMSAEGVAVSVDLGGLGPDGFVGYRAKRHTGLIDVDRRAGYDVGEFWEPIKARKDESLILDPDEFYILASKEAVQVPPDYAAEMVPFDPLVGEFRVHYAGFFDPGFGYAGAGGRGARAVLEVRSREVPFILEHGQTVGRLCARLGSVAYCSAFLALHPGETLDPEAVREYVRHFLARFSVPRDVIFVKYLPRNATGKVLARELRRYYG